MKHLLFLMMIAAATTVAAAQHTDPPDRGDHGESHPTFHELVEAEYPGATPGEEAIRHWAHRRSNPHRMYLGTPITEGADLYIDLGVLADKFVGMDRGSIRRSAGRAYWPINADRGVILNVGGDGGDFDWRSGSGYQRRQVHYGVVVEHVVNVPHPKAGASFRRYPLEWARAPKYAPEHLEREEWRWRVGVRNISERGRYTAAEAVALVDSLFECLATGNKLSDVILEDESSKVLPDGWCPEPSDWKVGPETDHHVGVGERLP